MLNIIQTSSVQNHDQYRQTLPRIRMGMLCKWINLDLFP